MPTLRSLVRFASRLGGADPAVARRPRDRRRSAMVALAVGVAAALLLHVGLAVAAEYSHYLRDPVYSDKERKLARVERALPTGSPVVVYVGTSPGNGFDAGRAQDALTDALGRPAGVFNFGTPASGPVTHFLHVRRLIADGHRPALLLLEIHGPTLAELPDGPLEGRFANGTVFSWEELDLLARYDCTTEKLREKRMRVLYAPWSALRFQLIGRLAPTSLPYYLRHDWSRGPDPNGWNPILVEDLDAEQRRIGLARAEREYKHILKEMKLGDGSVRAIRDTLALCREQGIPVMLVRMPEGSTFRALYPRAVDARVEQFVNQLSAEFGCRVADCRGWMPDQDFADGHHLLRGPAGAFSERLARDVLAPALGAGGAP